MRISGKLSMYSWTLVWFALGHFLFKHEIPADLSSKALSRAFLKV